MSRYDVASANTNRTVRFRIEADGEALAGTFGMLRGRNNQYPFYGQVTTVPTDVQELAQLRTNLVVQAMSQYAIVVGVELAASADEDGVVIPATATAAPSLIVTFEQDSFGAFYNNAWGGNTVLEKHLVTDITDVVGIGGMNDPKTKPGLQSLVNELADVSYDGGTTGPFGAKSAAAVVLPDGRTIVTGSVVHLPATTNASGLTVTYIGQ